MFENTLYFHYKCSGISKKCDNVCERRFYMFIIMKHFKIDQTTAPPYRRSSVISWYERNYVFQNPQVDSFPDTTIQNQTFSLLNHQSLTTKKSSKMTILPVLLSSFFLATVNSLAVEKAASPYTNIGCQCSSLTFVDSSGHIQGNCKSVDHTGAQWCYVDHLPSSCQDLVHSARFPNNPWSYEACATPLEYQPSHAPHHQTAQLPYHQPAHLPHHQPANLPHHQVVQSPFHQPAYASHIQPAYSGHHEPVHGHHNTVGHHQGPGHTINTFQPSGRTEHQLQIIISYFNYVTLKFSFQVHSFPSLLFSNLQSNLKNNLFVFLYNFSFWNK